MVYEHDHKSRCTNEERQLLKIDHETLTDRAYAALKKALIIGEFPPGHVLVIRSVAEAYGISATPVREALQRLVAERVLLMQPNRSIIVPYLSADRFNEICHIRCALEGTAAELAVSHTDREHLLNLEKIVEDIDRAIGGKEIQVYAQLNQKFHFALYERAGSPLLLGMIKDFWCNVGPFFTRLFDNEDYLPHANEFHRKILQALRDGDAAQVRQSVVADISEAARSLMPRLQDEVKQYAEPTQIL